MRTHISHPFLSLQLLQQGKISANPTIEKQSTQQFSTRRVHARNCKKQKMDERGIEPRTFSRRADAKPTSYP